MSIWVLLMVLLTPIDGFSSSYFLGTFNTFEDCQKERNRVGFDMAEAYPADLSFHIECREKKGPGTQTSAPTEQTNYTDIITKWAKVLHPQEILSLKVLTIKPVLGSGGPTGVLAFQLHMFYKTGTQAYIIFIRNATVIGWIDAGVPDIDEEAEAEEQEVFSHKDAA